MKYFILFIIILLLGCGKYQEALDGNQYKSITDKLGKVTTNITGKEIVFDSVTIAYSNSDAMTLLIKNKYGKYIYIQGGAIIEFYDFNVNSIDATKKAVESYKEYFQEDSTKK